MSESLVQDVSKNIRMFVLDFFTRSNGNALACSYTLLNVVDCDVSMRVTDSNHVLLSLSICTTSNTVISDDVKLREIRVGFSASSLSP